MPPGRSKSSRLQEPWPLQAAPVPVALPTALISAPSTLCGAAGPAACAPASAPWHSAVAVAAVEAQGPSVLQIAAEAPEILRASRCVTYRASQQRSQPRGRRQIQRLGMAPLPVPPAAGTAAARAIAPNVAARPRAPPRGSSAAGSPRGWVRSRPSHPRPSSWTSPRILRTQSPRRTIWKRSSGHAEPGEAVARRQASCRPHPTTRRSQQHWKASGWGRCLAGAAATTSAAAGQGGTGRPG